MHYCDCKGTTKLQLLQRVFQRMLTIIIPPSRKSYHEDGDIWHGIEQILYVILDSIVWLYGVAKIQQAGNYSKGAFPLMLCHVLCHPLITMSSYVGRFLREYPVPNP